MDVRKMSKHHDKSFSQAALLCYQKQIEDITKAMAHIRSKLDQNDGTKPRGRRLSAEARKRIADAQKKRWAEFRKNRSA